MRNSKACPECYLVLRDSADGLVCDCGYVAPPAGSATQEDGFDAPIKVGGPGPDLPEAYELWNEVIAEVVYSPDMKDRPAYLNVDEEMLERCGELLSLDGGASGAEEALAASVSETLGDGSKLLSPHARWVRLWDRSGRNGPPPVLPLLAIFSLAAELMSHDEDIVSWNYYGRLWQVLNLDDLPDDELEKMEVAYRRTSLKLWEALNGWLRDLGGSRGVPTAEGRGNRRFVSVAIGQALVRQAERDRLPRFFGWAGLRPEQEVADDRMELLLGRWVRSSSAPLGNRTKRLWDQNPDLRSAFASTAVAELEGWDGITRRHGDQSGTLALAAVRSRRRGFGLRIAVVGSDTEPPASVAIGETEHRPAWRDLGAGLWVDRQEPPTDILAHTLRAGSLVRQQRQVTVFRQEADTYLEAPAVELGERFIVVAVSGLRVVREAIETFARPGWSEEQVGTWSVYLDVVVAQTVEPDALPMELQPLTTLSGQALGLVGGLKLPGGPSIWHVGAPPTVVVAVPPRGSYALSVQTADDEGPRHELGVHEGVVEKDLGRLGLGPGQWRVRLVGASEHVANFTLLASDEPTRRWLADPAPWIGRDGATGIPAVYNDRPATPVVGTNENEPAPVSDVLVWAQGAAPAATSRHTSLEIANATKSGDAVARSEVPCFEGGWHRVDLDANPGKKECDYCNVVPGSARLATERFRAAVAGRKSNVSRVSDELVDGRHLLDALVHLRGGGMDRLYAWLSRAGLDGLTQYVWRRDLMAIGHAEFDERGRRWSMLAPSLLGHATADGAWLLSGCITGSQRLLLREAVREMEGRWDVIPQGEGLRGPRTMLRDLSLEEAQLVATEVDGLEVHPDAGSALAARLPSLDALVSAGPERAYGRDTRARRYDPHAARWSDVQRPIEEAGAYRVGPGYHDEFWWVGPDGTATCVPDGDTAKFKAGAHEGVPHLAYVEGALVTPLGARLPPLYERAVVLASFRLPEERAGQTSYEKTPPRVAGLVAAAVHGHDRPEVSQ